VQIVFRAVNSTYMNIWPYTEDILHILNTFTRFYISAIYI